MLLLGAMSSDHDPARMMARAARCVVNTPSLVRCATVACPSSDSRSDFGVLEHGFVNGAVSIWDRLDSVCCFNPLSSHFGRP
jgi:hypothetical protein